MREEKLLQRCLKICEATTKRLLATTNNINRIGTTSHIHDNINTGLSCSSSQTVTECRAFSSSDVFDKEKDMIQPFHVFEKGSTSSTTNDSCTPISETITTKGKSKIFIDTDEAIEFNNQIQLEDLLHTLNPPGNMFVVITPIQGSGRGVTPGCK
uniref:Uncharacterized protein isoform X3 n=1 Tax=Nicotiana tabacum TaxID=4097 RepID=A0A1S4ACA0_TOBAC|nr:PREDICTED: uncharacterized protein LOC107796029 isoform X3 [Nicotiana tabacum]